LAVRCVSPIRILVLSIQGEGRTSSQGTGRSVNVSSSADSTEVRAAALPLSSGPPPPPPPRLPKTVVVEPEGSQDAIPSGMLAWRVLQCRVVTSAWEREGIHVSICDC